MHLLTTRQAGFVEDDRVVVRLDQTPADVVVLSSADSTLALLATACQRLAATVQDLPSLRLANLLHLRQPASIDLYVDDVLCRARVIVVDHLGAESAWPYGVQQLGDLARRHGQWLVLFSGDLHEDENLLRKGTAPLDWSRQLWRYLRAGGPRNAEAFLLGIAHRAFGIGDEPPSPQPMPPVSLHLPGGLPSPVMAAVTAAVTAAATGTATIRMATTAPRPATAPLIGIDDLRRQWQPGQPVVALVFYRSHLQAGHTAAFDALAAALARRGLNPLPIAVDSLKDPTCGAAVRTLCEEEAVAVVLNTTAFAATRGDAGDPPLAGDAPVLQAIVCGTERDAWQADPHGLRPRDIAMQIALPEIDGRIINRAISFKGLTRRCDLTQTDLTCYEPDLEGIEHLAELAARWCRLRQLPTEEKRVALVLANYPGSEGRIGSGVGLDTPAAVIRLLARLREEGHILEGHDLEGHDLGPTMPADGDALMRALCEGIANDPAQWPLRPAFQSLSLADYRRGLAALPPALVAALAEHWGEPEDDPLFRSGRFMIAGLRLGHVFVGIQPSRVYGADGHAAYHDAERVPPHGYVAFYLWLREVFRIDAIVHVGKHGNLEWLPGKSVALSRACWPDAVLGPLPHLYPFIVNDPGEGAQAKRRTQAVIIDHLMPPLTRAESFGPLQDLERDVDEYYGALLVDARRAELLRRQILARIRQQKLDRELDLVGSDDDALLARVDAWLCELKETQIRDGLHVFGQSPVGRQRRDTLLALVRLPSGDGQGSDAGLLQALADDLLPDEGFDPLDIDAARTWQGARPPLLQAMSGDPWRHAGDTRERLELLALALLEATGIAPSGPPTGRDEKQVPVEDEARIRAVDAATGVPCLPRAMAVLERVRDDLAGRLDACGPEELRQFSRALQGRFVPPGPSGSPSRGRPDVLPTGRNFYGLDTRAVPTPTAWALGVKSADLLLETHLQKQGDYPRAVGLSVWGTATMRTGGDDIAQAFALLGVRPRWAAGSHRVVDVEVLPIVKLGRPRIDVTLRISGFFRDAFPNVVQLFDAAVRAVADQNDEDDDVNPVRARILAERDALVAEGLDADTALDQAGWRVFGNAPGDYGTGLQHLLHHGQWRDSADLAEAWIGASAHAWSATRDGAPAGAALRRRLGDIDAVVQNQDSREHDLLDSGDYLQFQGSMTTAVEHQSGSRPAIYHSDHGNPAAPRIRPLKEEIARIIRTRVVNPKWLAGIRRHGYKGGYEMAATVDYLFGFDATTGVVEDHQYAMVADQYLLDDDTAAFLARHNPQALADIAARLLEAMDRGLWEDPGPYRDRIEHLLLDHEARLERGLPTGHQ